MTAHVYLNGRILPARRASISIDDHGFLYGDGVYETLRVQGGHVRQEAAHLARLARSLSALRIQRSPRPNQLRQAISKIIERNGLSDAVIRITVTRGPGPRGLDPRLCPTPTVLITAVPMPGLSPSLYGEGVDLLVARTRRNSPSATPPWIKSISCLNGVLAKLEAIDAGAFEALMLAADGGLAEGTVTNLFLVRHGRLLTPRLDGTVLAGVTRDAVVRLARRAGHRVVERRLTVADLRSADEAFLTSTVLEIVPVTRLVFARGARPARVGDGRVGPITAALMARFRRAAGGAR